MEWIFTGDAPIYTQIVERFRQSIASGELAAGERLQPVRELAVTAGVNPNTMQRALSELERDGLVYTQRTSGRFVTEDESLIGQLKRTIAARHIRAFLTAMEGLGYTRDEVPALIQAANASSKEEQANGNA